MEECLTESALPLSRLKGKKGAPEFRLPKVMPALLEAAAALLTVRASAGYAKCSPESVSNWLDEGRQAFAFWEENDGEDYDGLDIRGHFYMAWHYARSKKKLETNTTLLNHASDPKAWAAAATILERMEPDEYGQRQAIAISSKQEVVVKFEEVNGNAWQMGQIASRDDVIDVLSKPQAALMPKEEE